MKFTVSDVLAWIDEQRESRPGQHPEAAGNYAGEPGEAGFRQSVISKVDEAAPTGVSVVEEFFASETAEAYDFSSPCF